MHRTKPLLLALALLAIPVAAAPSATAVTPAPPSISDRPLYHPGLVKTAAALATVDAANAYVDRNFPLTTGYFHTTFCGSNCPNGTNPFYATTALARIDTAPDSNGYFFAHQFDMHGDGTGGGYVGLQTILITNGVNQGNGFIFSIFGATGGATGPMGGTLIHGTNEGDFWSLHVPFDWQVGHTYQYNVTHVRDAGWGLTTSVTATIYDKTTPATFQLGTLTVPATWGGFESTTFDWTEEYSPGSYPSCSAINPARVRWSGASYLTPTYPPQSTYGLPPANPHIATDSGCSNSASNDLGVDGGAGGNHGYEEVVGALS